jgi:hypothetical protein
MKKHSNTPFRSIALPALLLASAMAVHAGPRSSANYTLATDTTDAGGSHATSSAYTHDGSVGGVVGISAVSTPAETAKHGYLDQLYEVAGLHLSSNPPAVVDEETTAQLAAWHLLEDASFLALPATAVLWHPNGSFPLTIIDTTGLATAAAVYRDTDTTVTATQGEIPHQLTAELNLTVHDIDPDNFGSYAGDGIDDSWQKDHFGLENPNAAPLMDPDGDTQNNRFEFTAGLIPTDPLSRFLLRIYPVAGQPTQKRLIFSPRFDDRTYDILTSTTLLGGAWSALTGGIVSDNDTERTVIDPDTGEGAKFYRVQVVKP